MSNESENKMSNERIDLTQFERILNGPWSLVDGNEVLVCPTEECLGWCECGKGVPTKGRWIWQYIIGADIDTGRDLVMATVEQTIDEVMGWDNDGNYNIPPKEEGIAYATAKAVQMLPDLITELKRCYEELDSLPTRWQMSEIHNYTKWLETVESYFLADGSFNQDADFVRKCAVNEQYGYRIEVIDGVETVVHESEYPASE
jgi:hypothetical protein